MAEIVNLRRARKAKLRAEKQRRAGENRQRFGRTRRERELADAERALEARRLDGMKRADGPSGDDR